MPSPLLQSYEYSFMPAIEISDESIILITWFAGFLNVSPLIKSPRTLRRITSVLRVEYALRKSPEEALSKFLFCNERYDSTHDFARIPSVLTLLKFECI